MRTIRSEYSANVLMQHSSVQIGKQFYTPARVRAKPHFIKGKQDRIVMRGAFIALAVLAQLVSSGTIPL